MKVIDLKRTCVFTNDIVNVYEKIISNECGYDYKWYLQTKTNCIEISYDDYSKVKNYMTSLNKNTPKEDKKIDKKIDKLNIKLFNSNYIELVNKINEIIDRLNGEDNE